MRDLRELDKWRVPIPENIMPKDGKVDLSKNGAFIFTYEGLSTALRVIASSGGGWDHVSVSLADRCPTWHEMDAMKRVFFRPDEVAMQLHPAEKDHVNCHPFTLHLWRPNGGKRIPLPPKEFV